MVDITSAILSLEPKSSFVCKSNDYNKIQWLDSSIEKPTYEEVLSEIERLEKLEPMKMVREKRDELIAATDWMAVSDRVMTQAQIEYRQALRELPETADPQLDENGQLTNVTWPTYE